MHDPFPDITAAARDTAASLGCAATSLDALIAKHLPTRSRRAHTITPVVRVFCPHCETWQTGDHCADDISTGVPFKVYVCHGCEGDIVTTEPSDEITATVYIDLCEINPQAADGWRITDDGSYARDSAREAVA